MAGGRPLPTKPLDRDLRALQRRIRYLGSVSSDPRRPGDGWAWVRSDRDPPELRVFVNGATYKLELQEV